MFYIKNILLTLLTFCVSFAVSQANTSSIHWQSWDEKTLIQAQQQDKLVLIKLTAKWCQFCKKMDLTTYQNDAVIDEVNQHYIAIKVDEEKHPKIAAKYSQVGFPGTVILDKKGKQLLSKTGYLKPQWMLWTLQAMSQPAGDEIAHE